jgi:hypothetical protein
VPPVQGRAANPTRPIARRGLAARREPV